jgi:catechol 2,3-dioxygenase-like lactoylglutathione lyase family enzyme
MKLWIAHVAVVVDYYDDALRFYTEKLDFILLEDAVLNDTKRWVRVAPPGATECCLLLTKAANERQETRIGNQTGGRVFLFLYTDNFWRDYQKLSERKVKFIRFPLVETYGTVAVFEDLYGNLWDLLEPSPAPTSSVISA